MAKIVSFPFVSPELLGYIHEKIHRRKKRNTNPSIPRVLKVEIDFSSLHGKLSKIVENWDFMTALWFDISTSSLEVRVSCWKEKIQEFVFLMHLEDAFHQNLLIKPHNTNTYTHIPIPPQKKTSTHYISEFFVCATFHSCIGSQTSGNRWVKETWIFTDSGVELGSKVIGNFSTFGGPTDRVAGVCFLGNFP